MVIDLDQPSNYLKKINLDLVNYHLRNYQPNYQPNYEHSYEQKYF